MTAKVSEFLSHILYWISIEIYGSYGLKPISFDTHLKPNMNSLLSSRNVKSPTNHFILNKNHHNVFIKYFINCKEKKILEIVSYICILRMLIWFINIINGFSRMINAFNLSAGYLIQAKVTSYKNVVYWISRCCCARIASFCFCFFFYFCCVSLWWPMYHYHFNLKFSFKIKTKRK